MKKELLSVGLTIIGDEILSGRRIDKHLAHSINYFQELGIDSLNGFDLLCDLEEELGIVIPDDDAREITTVRDVVECVKPLLQTPSS